ncbi:hypothetical protein F5148DRAFT_1226941 [Russula earlei]|uniref:Uncharacterized protein n=1 Tax=Russula earlei TaxID=71964 RepID=A0ACC0U0B4_9AGAM|nr:hypothetical protein F5148DRAFT_1226941 [Russula earlei]
MPLTRATTRAATATLLIAIAITTCHSPLSLCPLHLPFTTPSPLCTPPSLLMLPRQFRCTRPQNVCIKTLDQGWSRFQPPRRCQFQMMKDLP